MIERGATTQTARPRDGRSDALPLADQAQVERTAPERDRDWPRRLLPHAAVLATMTLVTIVATWPLLPNLGGFVTDPNNGQYSVWAMAWQDHSLATNPLGLFDTNIMYPFKGTLAFDELIFTQALLAAPFYWLTGNPVLSHNIVLIASFIFASYTAWLLVRELTGNTWAALVGGTAFGFSFYMFGHLAHQTLIHTEWIPLFVLAAYKLLWTRAWRWAVALGVFFALNALSGHYLAFYSALFLGLFFVYYLIVQRDLFSWGLVGKIAAGMGLSALLFAPVAVPYVLIQQRFDFSRSVFEAERFSNTLASFLAIFRGNPLYMALLAPFADPGPWAVDRSSFFGFFTLVMAALGAIWAWRYARRAPRTSTEFSAPLEQRRALGRHATFYMIVAVLSALLSLGPSLQLTYAPSVYDPNSMQRVMPLPYRLLYDWVPGFESMRVVSRIDVLITLALAVLVGIGAHYLLGMVRAGWGRRAMYATVALLALFPVFETWSAPQTMTPVAVKSAVPEVYRWLAAQPHTVILEYPAIYYQHGEKNVVMQDTYQYLSTYHWQDMINASTSIHPFSYSALLQETEDCFPCPRSVGALRAMGVKYVVVHLQNLSGPQRTDFEWRATSPEAKVLADFALVKDFGSDRVYEVKGPEDLDTLKDLIPPSEPVLLADPGLDPARKTGALVYGGYLATVGWFLRDRPLFGDSRLSFGQTIEEVDPARLPPYAVLWANEDPARAGYSGANRLWSNEFIALYRARAAGAQGSHR